MSAAQVMRNQAYQAPKESLAPYAGEWVVMRGGLVQAHDPDLQALADRRPFSDGDVLSHLPQAGGPHIF